MAPRKTVPRLALVAALAALLSGCYAHGGGRYSAHYGGGYAYQGAYRQAPSGHAPSGHAPSGHAPSGHAYDKRHAYDKDSHREPGRRNRAAARERDHRSEPTRRPESTRRLERSGQPRHDWNAQAPRQNRPQVQRRRNSSAETPRQNRPQVQRRRDPGVQEPRRNRRGSADRKAEPQPAPAEGYGRRDEWLPGPTARDEGPRPGAEGGAR